MPDKRGRINYSYFLMDDSGIKNDHIWEESKYPQCNNSKYNNYWNAANAVTYGDSIIYSNSSDNIIIYKMSLDAKTNEVLTNTSRIDLAISDYWIYFSNYSYGGYLYNLDKDGNNLTQLNNMHSSGLYVEDDFLYFEVGGEKRSISVAIEDKWLSPFIQTNSHPINKTWSIEFNKELDSDSISQDIIYIARDKYGKDEIEGFNISLDSKTKK